MDGGRKLPGACGNGGGYWGSGGDNGGTRAASEIENDRHIIDDISGSRTSDQNVDDISGIHLTKGSKRSNRVNGTDGSISIDVVDISNGIGGTIKELGVGELISKGASGVSDDSLVATTVDVDSNLEGVTAIGVNGSEKSQKLKDAGIGIVIDGEGDDFVSVEGQGVRKRVTGSTESAGTLGRQGSLGHRDQEHEKCYDEVGFHPVMSENLSNGCAN